MSGCHVLSHPPSASFYLSSRPLLPFFVVMSGKIWYLASVSSAPQCHSSPIPASLRLAFSVWVTLPTPHTPSSSVQKLSIQFYTRPHPSVNLPILFFFQETSLLELPITTAPPNLHAAQASSTAVGGLSPLLPSWAGVPLLGFLSSALSICSLKWFWERVLWRQSFDILHT